MPVRHREGVRNGDIYFIVTNPWLLISQTILWLYSIVYGIKKGKSAIL
jgi:hypothetical protein